MTAATPAPGRTIVHLVPHTHWDREWYEPFQTFRLRLVDLVDQLLERMEADGRLRFTLDGQCATVDDYLEVRPEAEPLIRRLVAEGRLAIGPWQILMDEFLVSGETLVRNLELGWARATELGGAMRVGYLPDMFGHVAQMPQILRRAGIDRAVVWRGVPAVIDRNTFTWESPDGSAVEAEYLVGGYGNGAHLFDVPDRLKARLARHVDTNEPFYGRHSILAMYGTDHAVPSPRLADLVDAINADDSPVVVRLETLAEYAARTDIEPSRDGLPRWTGELRSGARANMLMNVTSARVDVKIAAGRAERLLERYAEPLTALHATAWPGRPLELAWRRLVDNSAHDSICGCSHDDVVAQVLTRYAEAEQIGRGVLSRTLGEIASRVADRQLGRDQSLARPARGLRGIRRGGPARMGVGRAALRRSPDLIPGMRTGRPGGRRPQAPRFGDPRAVPSSAARPRAVRAPDQLDRHPTRPPRRDTDGARVRGRHRRPARARRRGAPRPCRGGGPGTAGRSVAAHGPRRGASPDPGLCSDARARLVGDRGRGRGHRRCDGSGTGGQCRDRRRASPRQRSRRRRGGRRRHIPPGGRGREARGRRADRRRRGPGDSYNYGPPTSRCDRREARRRSRSWRDRPARSAGD